MVGAECCSIDDILSTHRKQITEEWSGYTSCPQSCISSSNTPSQIGLDFLTLAFSLMAQRFEHTHTLHKISREVGQAFGQFYNHPLTLESPVFSVDISQFTEFIMNS